MRPLPLLLLLVAAPAGAQIRSAPAYEGTAPGHPADEPGPSLGTSAEDALALLARGDRDAARLTASRCLRSFGRDDGCRLVLEAVAADVEAPKVPPSGEGRERAEVHFAAGADYHFHGETEEARREWDVCRRLDPGHGFCALGLKVLASARARERSIAPAGRGARQAYLSGAAYLRRGDLSGARRQWLSCLALRPDDATAADCATALAALPR